MKPLHEPGGNVEGLVQLARQALLSEHDSICELGGATDVYLRGKEEAPARRRVRPRLDAVKGVMTVSAHLPW